MTKERIEKLRRKLAALVANNCDLVLNSGKTFYRGEQLDLLAILGDYEAALPALEAAKNGIVTTIPEELSIFCAQTRLDILRAALAYKERSDAQAELEKPAPSTEERQEMLGFFNRLNFEGNSIRDIELYEKLKSLVLAPPEPAKVTPPKVNVTRKWVFLTAVDMWGFKELEDAENKLAERLRELGHVVEDEQTEPKGEGE